MKFRCADPKLVLSYESNEKNQIDWKNFWKKFQNTSKLIFMKKSETLTLRFLDTKYQL
jgi:hypothetical protein